MTLGELYEMLEYVTQDLKAGENPEVVFSTTSVQPGFTDGLNIGVYTLPDNNNETIVLFTMKNKSMPEFFAKTESVKQQES